MKRTRKFTILLVMIVLVMCGVFVRGFLAGGKQEESEVSTLAKASIPTVTMNYQGEKVNCLQGYANSMTLVERLLTPLEEELRLTIDIGETPYKIMAVEYSVSRDGICIEQRRTEKLSKSGDVGRATLDLSNSVTANEEFQLQIALETAEEQIFYYYTRVIYTTEFDAAEAIVFAREFCENTFDKKSSDKIITYIEPDDTGDNTTFQHVNIHSSYDQITWGKLDAKMCSRPIPNILELNDTEAVVSLDYQAAVNEDEETNSYYLVHEYYRMRRSSYRMHLLEYERDLTQTFVGTKLSFTGQSITLGIVPEDVEYLSNEEGTFVCFVQAGELWLYEIDGSKLYRIFSLQDTQREDKRSFMQDYEIRILNLDSKGAVDFVVYGYCNRGNYEGKVCLQLCRYTKNSNTYEVRYVMEDTCSAQLFCEDIGTLTYLSENDFYYYYHDDIHHLDLMTGKETTLVENLDRGALAVSDNHEKIAWVEDMYGATTIYQMDLKTNEQSEIVAKEKEYLRPIGFVNEDFAYGIAKKSMVQPGRSGVLWFPMYSVVICDKEGKVIKDYTDETLLVVDGYTTDEMIHLERVKLAAGGMGYVTEQAHQIVSSQKAKEAPVTLGTTKDTKKLKLVQLVFATGHAANAIHRYTAEEVVYTTAVQRTAQKHTNRDEYFVYCNGKLAKVFENSKDAFVYTEVNNGILKTADQRTVYYKRVPSDAYEWDMPPVFDVTILQQAVAEEASRKGLVSLWQSKETGKKVYDATGISLEATKQLVEDGWSVLIQTGAKEFYLLMGYTEETVLVYQPTDGQTSVLATQQIEGLYKQYGNVCILCK